MTPRNQTIKLSDFLTKEQIAEAFAIYSTSTIPAREICDKVIRPNIKTINEKLGQENDPLFLGYACEYVFKQANK